MYDDMNINALETWVRLEEQAIAWRRLDQKITSYRKEQNVTLLLVIIERRVVEIRQKQDLIIRNLFVLHTWD